MHNRFAIDSTLNQRWLAVCFTNESTGYTPGFSWTIFITTNGGNTRLAESSGARIDFNGLDFLDANTGVAVGGSPDNSDNIIVRTTNAGNNWETIPYTNSTCKLYHVRFMSATVGYITGYCGRIIRTTDGGASWCNQVSPVNCNFTDCFFTNNNTGYLVGRALITGLQWYFFIR
jgi:photosystem II stability/assembly factor-like uncharacterized protein